MHPKDNMPIGVPYPVPLSRRQVEAMGEDAEEIVTITEQFERLLPALIINIALCALDWHTPDALAHSPFPAAARHAS